jgi:hypothetical protein
VVIQLRRIQGPPDSVGAQDLVHHESVSVELRVPAPTSPVIEKRDR